MNEKASGAKIMSLGLQHVLAMYAGAILVPLLVGRALKLSTEELSYLVAIDLLTCGIATLLQAWKTKYMGLVQLSNVKTKNVVVAAGGILVVLGCIPKIAAVATIIPTPVLGGAMVVMFGMVVSSGIKMLSSVDFGRQENLLIIACAIALGMGVTAVPEFFAKLPQMLRILVGDGIITGSLTAILLNVFFNLRGRSFVTSTEHEQALAKQV